MTCIKYSWLKVTADLDLQEDNFPVFYINK